MAVAGAKPKATALKVLAGNPGKRNLNRREPKPKPGIPVRPYYLKGSARKEWEWAVKEIPPGVLTLADRSMLALYCIVQGHIIDATLAGKQPNAALVAQSRVLASEFGLTPSARSRMVVEPPKEIDPFEALLNGSNRN
jgi:phage terminase small subunit